jgi:type IV pilus assembly protein PilA
MKKFQQGFTLIELMIVVAIIGILAAIAIPSYQDYTARAQMSEAVNLTAGLKTPLAEWYADKGTWPTTAASVGDTLTGKYVASVTLTGQASTPDVAVNALMKSTGTNTQIQGKYFSISTTSGGKRWFCGAPAKTAVGAALNDVDPKFLPASCR